MTAKIRARWMHIHCPLCGEKLKTLRPQSISSGTEVHYRFAVIGVSRAVEFSAQKAYVANKNIPEPQQSGMHMCSAITVF